MAVSIKTALFEGAEVVPGVDANVVLAKLSPGGFNGEDSYNTAFCCLTRADLEGLNLTRPEQNAVFHAILYALGEERKRRLGWLRDKWPGFVTAGTTGGMILFGGFATSVVAATAVVSGATAGVARMDYIAALESACKARLSSPESLQPEGQLGEAAASDHSKRD